MSRKVVITGMGAITPLGNDVGTFWDGIKKGKVAIAPITKYDASEHKVKIAAEVKDFDPSRYMDAKVAKRMEGFAQFAVAAATEAVEQSGLVMEDEDPYRVGVIVSSGIGSMQAHEREQVRLANGKKISPEEMESLLTRELSILECVVEGEENPSNNDVAIVATIVPDYESIKRLNLCNPDDAFAVERLVKADVEKVNKTLVGYKRISKWVIRREEFEKTTTRKIKRYKK